MKRISTAHQFTQLRNQILVLVTTKQVHFSAFIYKKIIPSHDFENFNRLIIHWQAVQTSINKILVNILLSF